MRSIFSHCSRSRCGRQARRCPRRARSPAARDSSSFLCVLQRVEIDRVERLLQHRHALLRTPGGACRPCLSNAVTLSCQRREVALHEPQIAIVLQAFLELVRCEQVIQVTRLGRVRQLLQLPVPADLVGLVVRDDRVEQIGRCGSPRSIDRCAAIPGRTRRRRTCTARPPACSRRAAHKRTERRGRIPARRHRACCARAAPATAPAPSCSAARPSRPSRRRAAPCSIADLPDGRAAALSSLRSARPAFSHAKPSARFALSRSAASSSVGAAI